MDAQSILKAQLGELIFANIVLTADLHAAKARIAELEVQLKKQETPVE